MANSIHNPWIREYLIEVAESYGGDMASVPFHNKKKKGQLVMFLTDEGPERNGWVWAHLSDKRHLLPVRFSKESMQEYYSTPGMPDGLITNNKTALIYIENFRPMFTRVPKGRGLGMTKSSFIAFEVGSFGLYGSFNAEVWGSPRDVVSDPLISEWCEGLSSGGGGGNVLKARADARKEAHSGTSGKPVSRNKQAALDFSAVTREQPKKMKRVTRNHQETKEGSRSTSRFTCERELDHSREYYRGWRPVTTRLPRVNQHQDLTSAPFPYSDDGSLSPEPSIDQQVPQESPEDGLDGRSSPPPASLANESSQYPRTPSHWSASIRGSPQPSTPRSTSPPLVDTDDSRPPTPGLGSPMIIDDSQLQSSPNKKEDPTAGKLRPSSPELPAVSSSLAPPTPAQRPKPQDPSSSLQDRPGTPSGIAPNYAQDPLPAGRDLRQKREPHGISGPAKRSIYPDMPSRGRILVPNSDTSGTNSSQIRSQSLPALSQSQGLGDNQSLRRYSQSLSYVTGSREESQRSQPQPQPQSQPQSQAVPQSQSQSQVRSQGQSQLRHELLSSPEGPQHEPPAVSSNNEAESRHGLAGVPSREDGPAPAEPDGSFSRAPPDAVIKEDSPLPGPLVEGANSATESETDGEDVDTGNLFEMAEDSHVSNTHVARGSRASPGNRFDGRTSEKPLGKRKLQGVPRPGSQSIVRPRSPARERVMAARKRTSNHYSLSERSESPSSSDDSLCEAAYSSFSVDQSPPPPRRLPSPAIGGTSGNGNVDPSGSLDVQPATSTHDVESWRVPSFMRNRAAQRPTLPPSKKRAHPATSSSDDKESRMPKRRKIGPLIVPPPMPNPPLPQPPQREQPRVAPHAVRPIEASSSTAIQRNDSLGSTTSKLRQIDFRSRSGSVSSSRSHKSRPGKRSTSLKPQPVILAPQKVSSRGGKDRTIGNPSAVPTSRLTGVQPPPSAPSKGKGKEETPKRTPQLISPRAPSSTTTGSKHIGSAQPEIRGLPGPSRDAHRVEEIPSTSSGVYQLDMGITQTNGVPPITWAVLDDILLRVGKARHKELKHRKTTGG